MCSTSYIIIFDFKHCEYTIMWPDLTEAGFHTHNGLDFYINELTIHVCIIANGSLIWFSWGLFLRPVWCAQKLGWSTNGSGVTGQVSIATWLEITTQLAREPVSSNWLLCVISRAQWASGETVWQCSTSTHGKTHHFMSSLTTTPI